MGELFAAATAPVTLPVSLALTAVALYWVTVVLGFLDIDILDADLDLEVGETGVLSGLLSFDGAPATVGLSLWVLWAWVLMTVSVHYLALPAPALWALYLPAVLVAFGITRLFTRPLGRLFVAHAGVTGVPTRFEGTLCRLEGEARDGRTAQARIETPGGSVLVMVQARPGKTYPRGSNVLIIEKDESGTFYYVEAMDELEQ